MPAIPGVSWPVGHLWIAWTESTEHECCHTLIISLPLSRVDFDFSTNEVVDFVALEMTLSMSWPFNIDDSRTEKNFMCGESPSSNGVHR